MTYYISSRMDNITVNASGNIVAFFIDLIGSSTKVHVISPFFVVCQINKISTFVSSTQLLRADSHRMFLIKVRLMDGSSVPVDSRTQIVVAGLYVM